MQLPADGTSCSTDIDTDVNYPKRLHPYKMHPSFYPLLGLLYPFKDPETLAKVLGEFYIPLT